MAGFKIFVKTMKSFELKLRNTLSFCFLNTIPDSVTAFSIDNMYDEISG